MTTAQLPRACDKTQYMSQPPLQIPCKATCAVAVPHKQPQLFFLQTTLTIEPQCAEAALERTTWSIASMRMSAHNLTQQAADASSWYARACSCSAHELLFMNGVLMHTRCPPNQQLPPNNSTQTLAMCTTQYPASTNPAAAALTTQKAQRSYILQ